MGRSETSAIRSLPRVFVPEVPEDCSELPLPDEAFDKFHKVLRLRSGAEVLLLPNDGRALKGVLQGRSVLIQEAIKITTESLTAVTCGLALSKPETLEASVRMATEIGVAHFAIFPSDRSVVKWEAAKLGQKVERLNRIVKEACEVSFRGILPSIQVFQSLSTFLESYPQCQVLSEWEYVQESLSFESDIRSIAIGPEGGWSPREVEVIGPRARTLGRRVFRVDTAVAVACSLAVLK